MSPRVPGTSKAALRLEVATGGNPDAALLRAVGLLPRARGGVWDIAISHDDGCPTLAPGQSLAVCSCEILELGARRLA